MYFVIVFQISRVNDLMFRLGNYTENLQERTLPKDKSKNHYDIYLMNYPRLAQGTQVFAFVRSIF